jgi:hypothetical protein
MEYYEKDDNGNPLTAYSSGIDWEQRGYDGFLGFGKQAHGGCCADCICDDTCELNSVFVRYTWFAPCRDLDTNTSFRDSSAGFFCPYGDDIFWVSNDNVERGGFELAELLFEKESLPTDPNEWEVVTLHAHWYSYIDDDCDGKFTIHVTSDDQDPTEENTLLFKELTTFAVQSACSTNLVAKFKFNATDIIWDE